MAPDIQPLSDVFPVFEFDFANSPNSDEIDINCLCDVHITESGIAHGVVFWWDLHMDEEISFNTGPPWVEGGGKQWRNHWMQAACLFEFERSVTKVWFM